MLGADFLCSLMCIEIGVLFSIMRVVGMWNGLAVSAAAVIKNDCKIEFLVAGFQNIL